MTCLAPEKIAEAVTTGDDAVLAHVEICVHCQELLDGQREIHALVQTLPDPPLRRSHREALAAEVMARADALPPERSSRIVPVVAIAVAIAAIVALLVYLPGRGGSDDTTAAVPPPPAPAPRPTITPVPDAPVPEPTPVPEREVAPKPAPVVAKAKVAGTGEFAREGDVVRLTRGDVTVDATGAHAVSVVQGDTAALVKGRATVIAKRGVIQHVAVFAGAAEITVGGKTVVIEQGMTWERNASREDSLAAFRTGWELLRDGKNAEAIAQFDLAKDDVVAEDAMYWAAVASERMGDTAGALARYRAFVSAYPSSARADAATTSIARLVP